ncbi:hypothetical protein Bca4012_062428 [Brassica carinata]|uniref:F-box associated beta-propeller type 1 domain-containing protein n=1 Tax=Brassica carinata TaxID=52824 RepID=A0A8X7SCF8_BRACI|nr:hypothetical protein Bca52824_032324 [Brassica carinata]
MRAVRLTCKEWDALSKSRSFSKMHIDKLSAVREGESMTIAWIDYNLYLIRVILVDNEDPVIECKGKLNKQIKISKVIHCDGLLLCVLEDDATKVVVCNPYWGQTRSIEFRYSHSPHELDRFTYALGYEDKGSRRSYKFLRFIDMYVDYETKDLFLWYEIYDFDSSTWKTLDVTPHFRIQCYQRSVSLKGSTYWSASQRKTEEYFPDDHIICFDFTSESFGPSSALPFDVGHDDDVSLSCVREEKLAVLLTRTNEASQLEFEIWTSTKIEAEKVLWSKFLTVVETEAFFYPLITGVSFLIDEEKKVAMGYSKTFNIVGEDGYLKMFARTGRDINRRVRMCSYVPSLVQPGSGGQRKHQSDLEKQRYDQNLSRLASIEGKREEKNEMIRLSYMSFIYP